MSSHIFILGPECPMGFCTRPVQNRTCHLPTTPVLFVFSVSVSRTKESESVSYSLTSDSLWPLDYSLYQASLFMGFSRHEYWSGLPFPSPGDLSHSRIEPGSPALADRFFTVWTTRKATIHSIAQASRPLPPSQPPFFVSLQTAEAYWFDSKISLNSVPVSPFLTYSGLTISSRMKASWPALLLLALLPITPPTQLPDWAPPQSLTVLSCQPSLLSCCLPSPSCTWCSTDQTTTGAEKRLHSSCPDLLACTGFRLPGMPSALLLSAWQVPTHFFKFQFKCVSPDKPFLISCGWHRHFPPCFHRILAVPALVELLHNVKIVCMSVFPIDCCCCLVTQLCLTRLQPHGL